MPRLEPIRGAASTATSRFSPLVCLALTLATGCSPADPPNGTARCRGDHDCHWASVPFCRCDGLCWSSVGEQPDAGVDAGPPPTQTFVVAALRSEALVGDAEAAFGIDLDMRVDGTAGSCTDQDDYVSPITMDRGIDNIFAYYVVPLLDGITGGDGWDGEVAHALEDGSHALVLEVTAVPGDACARRVHAWTARAMDAAVPSATCASTTDDTTCDDLDRAACQWHPATGTCAGIAAGQTWLAVVDLGEVDATLVAGRLRTTAFPRIPIVPELAPPVGAAPIDLHGVIFEADLHDDALSRGELGGAIHVSDAIDWFNTNIVALTGWSRTDPATFTAVVPPDLAPSADGHSCADFSAGFGFTAIAATLVHAP